MARRRRAPSVQRHAGPKAGAWFRSPFGPTGTATERRRRSSGTTGYSTHCRWGSSSFPAPAFRTISPTRRARWEFRPGILGTDRAEAALRAALRISLNLVLSLEYSDRKRVV